MERAAISKLVYKADQRSNGNDNSELNTRATGRESRLSNLFRICLKDPRHRCLLRSFKGNAT